MAHPIVSFQFADAPPVCFFHRDAQGSLARITLPSEGIYRQFELIYIVADERDVIRLRTNLTGGETTRLYPHIVRSNRVLGSASWSMFAHSTY